LVAAKRWGASWAGRHVLIRSDNAATVAAINNTTSRSPDLLLLIKELFWLSVEFDFRVSAKYLPGVDNILSDRLSRLHSIYNANVAFFLLYGFSKCACCNYHMSYRAYLSLQKSWETAWRC
jgi:hypothetical protein